MQVILTYPRIDFNALASVVLAGHLYPEAKIIIAGKTNPKVRDFIEVRKEQLPELLLDSDFKNEPVDLVVLVGVREPYRLGRFADYVTQPYIPVHIYDNHKATHQSILGDLEMVEEQGCTVTVLLKKIQEKGIELSEFEATLCLLALYEETGAFTYAGTTWEDIAAASAMVRSGGRLDAIVSVLSRRRFSEVQRSLISDLTASSITRNISGRQCLFMKAETDGHTDDLSVVADRIMELESCEVLFCAVNMGRRSYITARSQPGTLDVCAIVRELGGSGHSTSAFACVKQRSLDSLVEEIVSIAEARAPKVLTAAELMTSPVDSLELTKDLSVEEAAVKLRSMGHSAVCVCKEGCFFGMLSRADIDKAMDHGLGKIPVDTYVSSGAAALQLSTPVEEIRRILTEAPLGCAPVLDGKKLKGIVSRIDILRAMNFSTLSETSDNSGSFVPVEFVRLNSETLTLLKRCGEVGHAAGLKIFAVGGFVRDMLLHIASNDIDLVVEGNGMEFARILAAELGGTFKTHEAFGTAVVSLPDGLKLDVVTARTETYTRPAALPDVQGSTLKQDLYRRDFSINAMALQLDPESFGQLIDFFGARADLEKGVVRILHNLSFVDDPTRMFRAIKFEQRYGFHMDSNTEHLLKSAVGMGLVKMVTPERLGSEIWQIMQEPSPHSSIVRMDELQVLQALDSRLELDQEVRGHLENGEILAKEYADIIKSSNFSLGMYYLNILLLDTLPGEDIKAFVKKYALFPAISGRMLIVSKEKLAGLLNILADSAGDKFSIYKALSGLSDEAVLCLAAHSDNPKVREAVSIYERSLRSVEAPLRGSDLVKLGYRPGPDFSSILKWVLKEYLQERIADADGARAAVLENFPLPSGKK